MASGPPIPNPDCAPAALLLGAVLSVADSSRDGLEACAWLLDDRMRASRRCAHRSLPDSRRPPPLGRLGRLDRCRVGQQFRNLRWSRQVHTCFDRAGDGGRRDCLPICACAQAEEPLAPGGVHTELFWVKRSTTVACLSWGWVRPTAVNREAPGLAGAIPLFLGAETKSEGLKSTMEASASQGRKYGWCCWASVVDWLVCSGLFKVQMQVAGAGAGLGLLVSVLFILFF